jgi:hypothetical protein
MINDKLLPYYVQYAVCRPGNGLLKLQTACLFQQAASEASDALACHGGSRLNVEMVLPAMADAV